jgi:hypothetical protein
MTLAEYQRSGEITAIQLGMGLFADAILGARRLPRRQPPTRYRR